MLNWDFWTMCASGSKTGVLGLEYNPFGFAILPLKLVGVGNYVPNPSLQFRLRLESCGCSSFGFAVWAVPWKCVHRVKKVTRGIWN